MGYYKGGTALSEVKLKITNERMNEITQKLEKNREELKTYVKNEEDD